MPNRGIKGKKLIVLVSSILLVSLVLITVNIRQSQDRGFPESIIVWIVSPFQSVFTNTLDTISGGIDHYFFLVGVSRENERLLKEIDRLNREKNALDETIRRQGRVAKLLEQKEQRGRRSVIASVIGRDATQWSKMVFIDKGTKHGVRENLAVVSDAGVIGHIIQSTGATSKVLLITDSRSAIDSLFQDNRVPGVIVGTGEEKCGMKYVPITAEVGMGDKVISSGLGGIFPKGLMVGTVVQVTKKKRGLFQDIIILPSADLARLEEVMVLLQ